MNQSFANSTISDSKSSIFGELPEPMAYAHFLLLSTEFSKYHMNNVNIWVHFLTTPLGFLGVLSLIRASTNSSTISVAVTLVYCLSLLHSVSSGVLLGTVLLCMLVLLMSRYLTLGVRASLVCVVLGYTLQDAIHYIVDEASFQSTYSDGGHIDTEHFSSWISSFIDHTYYLLPLCINLVIPKLGLSDDSFMNRSLPEGFRNIYTHSLAVIPLFIWTFGSYCLDSKNGFCFFPGAYYTGRVLTTNLVTSDKECRKADLKKVRDWAIQKMPSKEMSSHWWFKDLDADEKAAFLRCATSSQICGMFKSLFSERHYCCDIVEGMNEVYVSGPSREDEAFNSDQIFYSRHVDGPMGMIPFVSVFRCIVGMDKNLATSTHFPMKPLSKNAMEGEVVAFDFNREIHYITRDPTKEKESDDFRVVLKLHYCLYPRVLAPLGWLMHAANVAYNMTFRALFLKTINPSSLYEHFLAWQVIVNTSLFNTVETFIGQRNVVYLILVASLAYVAGNYEVFLVMTSFVHYFRYISTYYYRSEVDYGSFKRDVLMFKTVALTQLALLYLFPSFMSTHLLNAEVAVKFSFDVVSVLMIASGYAISILATNALGLDRTYFGTELGFCEFKMVNQFPYGFIPHPMIVSQVWALVGIFKAQHMQTMLPYVVPIHILLYITHMVQEHFDYYERKPVPEANEKKSLSPCSVHTTRLF